MCISPNKLSDGSLVACRKCWQCLEHRVDAWVGRCIAESKTSIGSTFITLTYGRDENGNKSHARAAILTYSDVQKYFKQLRKRGFPARYIAVGEYGSEKGRSHWHIIVFWQKHIPEVMLDYGRNSWHPEKRSEPVEVVIPQFQRFNEPCWPHGFSQWDPVQPGNEKGSIRYACKYINKDFGDENWQGKFAMSKRPPMGAEYFNIRAQRFVDERISPQDAYYQFPDDARRKNGDIIRFKLSNKSLELFCAAFIAKWKEQVGGFYPPSVLLDEYEDLVTRREWDRQAAFAPAIQPKGRRWPFNPPFGYSDADIFIDYYRENAPWADAPRVNTDDGPVWYGPNKEGVRGWRSTAPEKEKPQPVRRSKDLSHENGPIQSRDRTCREPPEAVWIAQHLTGRWSHGKSRIAGQKPRWLLSMRS